MTDQQPSVDTALSVGEQFRQARERMGLTIDAVSKKLCLRPMMIEHIENNEFSHKNIPSTFMKGYLRNYAKLLKLPDSVWASVTSGFGENPKNDFNKAARAERVTNPHFHNRWVGYLTALVVLVVAGMTALWWWENYQQSNAERESLVQNYNPGGDTLTTGNGPATETGSPVMVAGTGIPVLQVAANHQGEPTAVSPDTKPADDESAKPFSLPTENAAVIQPEQALIAAAETPATSAAADNNAAPTPENQSPAVANGDLQIEITAATSWISVKDVNRKVLAQKEYKKGEILSFNEGAPYAVIIGAPGNVKITYKGENYPLKVDGRIAKFKLQ